MRIAMALLQMAAVIGSCMLVYRVAEALSASRTTAIAATLLVALDVRITVYEYLLMPEAFGIFLSLLW